MLDLPERLFALFIGVAVVGALLYAWLKPRG
jgi:heme A synthase